MGPTIVLLGSILGFIGAVLGWLVLDLSIVTALLIWIGSGPASLILLMLPRPSQPAPVAELRRAA